MQQTNESTESENTATENTEPVTLTVGASYGITRISFRTSTTNFS